MIEAITQDGWSKKCLKILSGGRMRLPSLASSGPLNLFGITFDKHAMPEFRVTPFIGGLVTSDLITKGTPSPPVC